MPWARINCLSPLLSSANKKRLTNLLTEIKFKKYSQNIFDTFSPFSRDKLFPESTVKLITHQILVGLDFMHKHGTHDSASLALRTSDRTIYNVIIPFTARCNKLSQPHASSPLSCCRSSYCVVFCFVTS